MRVAEIMTKEVLTVKGDDSLAQAARLICCHHISGLPVVDERGKLVGIVSEKDILKAIYPSQAEFCEDPGAHMDFETVESSSWSRIGWWALSVRVMCTRRSSRRLFPRLIKGATNEDETEALKPVALRRGNLL